LIPPVSAEQLHLRTDDGLDLLIRKWSPVAAPTRAMVVAHGLGEHSGRYQHLGTWFAEHGFAVYAVDHRGHGQSGGKRGDGRDADQLVADLDKIVDLATREIGGPVVLVGHSFGGLIAVAYAMAHPEKIERLVVSAPAFKVKAEVPTWKRVAAQVLPYVVPHLQVSNEVDPAILSHDPSVVNAYRTDPLVHDKITAGLYKGTIGRGELYIARAAQLKVPFLLMHGAEDQLIDPEGSRRFFRNANRSAGSLRIYPGLYHEIFNEPQKEQVFQDVLAWLEGRPAPSPAETAKA
jgi:alpha-beta hydrolase superfamily lysophospholipase